MPDDSTVEVATITHEGREFTNIGACVYPTHAVAYLKHDAATGLYSVTAWSGAQLGAARVVSTWRAMSPNGYPYTTMQVRATINGVRYTGRCAGVGMLWRGRRMATK